MNAITSRTRRAETECKAMSSNMGLDFRFGCSVAVAADVSRQGSGTHGEQHSETAQAPTGLESHKSLEKPHRVFPDEIDDTLLQEGCKATLERAYSASKPEKRHMELLGHGNGFTFEASPYCSCAGRDGVHVLFAGEVGEWPGINAVNAAHDEPSDAHWLLDFYLSFMGCLANDVTAKALECLSQVHGSFAFVIYDELQKRVFAARDPEGQQPLYWGATDEGQLLFGSTVEDLLDCNPTATMFPAGTMFASERHSVSYSPGEAGWVITEGECPGILFSFIKDVDGTTWRGIKVIPRITSKGTLCGAVYKVASLTNLVPRDVQVRDTHRNIQAI
eukprot:jgi/Chrzof1/6620/Cz19g03010.t1